MSNKITAKQIERFLGGRDPMERIVSIECDFMSDTVSLIYVDDKGVKRIKKDGFKPFAWVKLDICQQMFHGDRRKLREKMLTYGINVKKLKTESDDGTIQGRLQNGYKFIFYATRKMSNQKFSQFFTEAGTPIYGSNKKDQKPEPKGILTVTPVEQYMISTGRRLFKGYDNYDDVKRMLFDIETQGLNPRIHAIEQIGIRTNKGFERVIKVDKNTSEIEAIAEFVRCIKQEKPDIIAGHNSENFDWDFIIQRCEIIGYDFAEMSKALLGFPIYKKNKETVLKLGGEIEYYRPTMLWGHNILDSLHAVRRAQAIDSNMESANLKYVTKYLNLNKKNRVYVDGSQITSVWSEKSPIFAFNDSNGDWYRITEERPIEEGYEAKSGEYIVERYLLDDIWETDKVELTLNESNFLIGKLLPTNFSRACTMGTAGIWKLIMLAWCYENDLAVPSFSSRKRFTGGLSRLLKTGYVPDIVKLDYNSLYPSIVLTWNVNTKIDIMHAMVQMLDYVLTQRELYKGLKAEAGYKSGKYKEEAKKCEDKKKAEELMKMSEHWKAEKSSNDKKQLPLKIFANSFFGSYGAPNIFPFGDVLAAEKVTCIGRMSLRLMISHFSNIGYEPIVGDTDGFNFKKPESFRYTKENPYIGKGLGRNVTEGKEYTEIDADVAEFEDLYMSKSYNGGINKMGLGIDELCDATINFARKNYADLMPDGGTKKVGNTIKSRKMSGYLKKFLDNGINQLLHGQGKEFIDGYYDYIRKIYNYQIPIKDIASKGKIKKSIAEYKEDCKQVTKSGAKKARQAWYELAIKNNINLNVGDTVYYINTGTKKTQTDVKRTTHKFGIIDGQEVELTGKVATNLIKEYCEKNNIEYKSIKTKERNEILKKFTKREEDEIELCCELVPNDIIESEKDVLCSEVDNLEYNVDKYIEQFNNRIKTLLVCFHPDIRDRILVTDPSDIPYFTEKESELVSGFPNKETDQDTYEALMTPEQKEVEFWTSIGEVPPFIEECGLDWDGIVQKYLEEKKKEDDEVFKVENQRYLDVIETLTKQEVSDFYDSGTIPPRLNGIVSLNSSDMRFYFKNLPDMKPSTGGYIFDDIQFDERETTDD